MQDASAILSELSEKDKARFFSKINKANSDQCWPWIGAKQRDGYGIIKFRGRQFRSHRVAWFIETGELDDSSVIRHFHCDNPPCCNPAHLKSGTHYDNVQDKCAKGRQARGDTHYSKTWPERQVRGARVPNAKMDDAKVIELRNLRMSGMPVKELQSRFGIGQTAAYDIINRKNWTHI